MAATNNLYVFDLSPKVIDEAELLKFDSATSIVVTDQEGSAPTQEVAKPSTPTKNQQECSTCKTQFGPLASRDDIVLHYKSDFHKFNLKRSLNGQESLTEAAFDDILERGSLESISGSEDSSDEWSDEDSRLPTVLEKVSLSTTEEDNESLISHMNTKSPFLLLKSPLLTSTQAFGAYKALFDSETLESGAVLAALKHMNIEESRNGISVLLMIGGGHFAGAVISHQQTKSKGNPKNHKESLEAQRVVVLDSKTFHRYTTRRKQGGSQSASDNARGKANSAGSSIRRYNEEALKKEVHELLLTWADYISKAQHIFIRATGAASKKILVGYEGAEIKSSDKRVKLFPFTTKRATLSEVKSAWVKLTHLVPLDLPKTKNIPEKKSTGTNLPSKKTPEPVLLSESDMHSKEIITLLRKSKAPFLINYLKKNSIDVNACFTPEDQYYHAPTALHYASSQGLHHMVKVLLTNLKADPTVVNENGLTAAQLASSEQVKSTFQVCRANLGESYCDWAAARVGAAKTAEEVVKEAEEVKQRAREDTARAIKEELANKTELEMKEPTFASGGRLGGEKVISQISSTSGMTEQQKMRFMREQRARAAMARMGKST